ncbi:MAG: folylpolyglutamate synthase/dihydrofolate synthase family protein [Hyphomicrobiaceae bacterium]
MPVSLRTPPLLAELRRRAPATIDLTLDRMRGLLASLGSPEQRLPPVVHIAGTNGKGSVLTLLRAMLEADGRRVHAYVSPPLRAVTEAVRLAVLPGVSRDIADDAFAGYLDRVLAASNTHPVTSFEAETTAAFLAFAETPADVLLLEVGMGGRLDATNVVATPALTILTPVGLDHQAFLGDTLAKIASAKAGIIKRGVPCVVARQEEEALDVIEAEASTLRAPLTIFGRDFDAYAQNGRLVYQDEDGLLDLPLPALAGPHQVENAGTAIAAALRLGDLRPSSEAIARGLRDVVWPGRFQPLPALLVRSGLAPGSELWVDGGHNRAAALAIAEALRRRNAARPLPLHLIVGMLASRDPRPYLEPLAPLAETIIAVPIPDTSRAYAASHTAAVIAEAARSLGARASEADGFEAALATLALAPTPIRVLIGGSLHLVGAVLEAESSGPNNGD